VSENMDAVVDSPPIESADTEAPAVAAEATPSYEYVDPNAFDGKYVKVKVDGEELDVPFNEALQGYQRQADYTRKTQELASQREQLQFAQTLQQALETNPSATIELLTRHYGADTANQMVADAGGVAPSVQVSEFDDPLEQRIWETEQRIAQYEQERASDQLQKEIGRLQSTYEDFEPQEVVREALRRGTTDLEGTYKQIAFDRVIAKLNAQQQAASLTQAQEQAVVQAKRDAGFVQGGASSVAPTSNSEVKITSVADAWATAKQQMGI
jgi:hypothetical protein